MKIPSHISITTIIIIFSTALFSQTFQLTGRVYKGTTGQEPPTANAIENVTVKLWASNTSGYKDELIDQTTTSSNGWYGLQVDVGDYARDYFIIEEIDPTNYISDGATSVGGTVLSSNLIQYTFGELSGTLTGNKFWDKPENTNPVADANGPYTTTVGVPVTLDGTGSYDPDSGDSIANYEWDTDNDGTYDKIGATIQVTYNSSGTVTVTLRVTDQNGATDTDQTTVTISSDQVPIADAGGPYSGIVGETITLDGSGSTPGDGTNTYEWDLDEDGNYGESGEIGQSVQHIWYGAGTYTVHLRITDDDNDVSSDAATVTITSEGTSEYDYGDAPDGISIYQYPTLKSNNGAYHGYDPDVFLGTQWDSESDGQPSSDASGDDSNGNDDEDGVIFSGSLVAGTTQTVNVTASIQGYLYAWIDFNQDGDWDFSGESVFSNQVLSPGVNVLAINVPANAVDGTTFARFRFSTSMITGFDGGMADGEVEDYQVTISSETKRWDYGDAPLPYPEASHELGGPYFVNWAGMLGGQPDADTSMQRTNLADGDDIDGNDDESLLDISTKNWGSESFYFLYAYTNLKFYEKNTMGLWIDWNGDGDWNDPYEEKIKHDTVYINYCCRLSIVPHLKPGPTFARIRIIGESKVSLTPDGHFGPGEVEDHLIEIPGPGDPGPEGGIIIGQKWNDLNGDGMMQPDEPYLSGWTIYIDSNQNGQYDNGEPTQVTDGSGMYLFTGLPAGTYKIGETPQNGWKQTCPGGSGMQNVTVDPDDPIIPIYNFGNQEDGSQTGERDYGDAPSNYPSASHLIGNVYFTDLNLFFTGGNPDAEKQMQRHSQALGDDNDAFDDESGLYLEHWLNFNLVLWMIDYEIPGNYPFDAMQYATFGLWIDWNGDQDWDDVGEEIYIDNVTNQWAGLSSCIIPPSSAKVGKTFARIRIVDGKDVPLTPNGDFGVGEVEDYEFEFKDTDIPKPEGGLIVGTKWNDLNNNGKWESSEPGLANWQIYLDLDANGALDPADPVTITDSNGHYLFSGLAAGTYIVKEVQQVGWTQTYPTGTGTHTVSVDPTVTVNLAYNFGNTDDSQTGNRDYGDAPSSYPSASHLLDGPHFGTSATNDVPDAEPGMQHTMSADGDDNNGVDDENSVLTSPITCYPYGGTPFVAGLSIGAFTYIPKSEWATYQVWVDWNADGDWSDTGESYPATDLNWQTSAAGWFYYFSKIPDVKPGKTFVRLRITEGKKATMAVSGDLGKGEVEDHEIEIPEPEGPGPEGGVIWGTKWNDMNGNGRREPGEPGLANWQIFLDLDSNGAIDPADPVVMTDSKGHYLFTGLAAGTYIVTEVLQPGWTQTFPASPGTHTVTVDPTVPYTLSYDFGNTQSGGSTGIDTLKWSQPPLHIGHAEIDTVCCFGWNEHTTNYLPEAADDWYCYDPRPVTDIRWWGCYSNWDSLHTPNPAPTHFHIGVWTNINKDENNEFAHPGEKIYEWVVDRSQLNEHATRCHIFPEPFDTLQTTFEYTYHIPPGDYFYQEGDSTFYWLSITAFYDEHFEEPPEHLWGWLTREHYFHADAVRMLTDGHNNDTFIEGEPISPHWDLAFELGTDKYTREFDFGDAPEVGYATLIEHNGAMHRYVQHVFIGDRIDFEDNGLPHPDALGDDNNNHDDEDGLQFPEHLLLGEENQCIIKTSTYGFVSIWLDINQDRNWYNKEDCVLYNIELPPGEHQLSFFLPEHTREGLTAARIRFSTEPELWFNGFAIDGEVEDYMVSIQPRTDVKAQKEMPKEFKLFTNYPNPFNPFTTIKYSVKAPVHVNLSLYNIRGQLVKTLVNSSHQPGTFRIKANLKNLPSGLYFYRIEMGEFSATQKMVKIE